MSRGRRSGSRCRGSATTRAAWRRSDFNVYAHRVAAYVFAALLAGLGGVLLVWSNGEIAPGTVSVSAAIDILIIAVVGGIANPIGPFIGALIYVVLRTFALDFLVAIGLDGNRFRLLIGFGFLAIVFFSPDGVLGLWERWRSRGIGRKRPRGAAAMDSVAQRLSAVGTGNALELRGVTQAVRRARGADRYHADGAAGRAPRGARLQRRRQDDAVQLHHRRFPAELGHDPLFRRGRHRLPAL